jgi:hypothetical protein
MPRLTESRFEGPNSERRIGSFAGDQYQRAEIVAYNKLVREEAKVAKASVSVSTGTFLVEREAARFKMYDLIGTMNKVGVWAR